MSEDIIISSYKQDFCHQINRFNLNIDVKGYFLLDGKFVATVNMAHFRCFEILNVVLNTEFSS